MISDPISENPERGKVWTTRTGAKVLGIKQDTLKCYAIRLKVGSQPGGPGTPYLFTTEDLLKIRNLTRQGKHGRWIKTQKAEDRDALGLGPLYDSSGRPRG